LDNGYVLEKKGGGQRKNLSKYSQNFIAVIFFFKWQDEISNEHNYFRLEMGFFFALRLFFQEHTRYPMNKRHLLTFGID
jgi:hypothetical protein